jgi:uncharacterized protein (TIGR03437 family)
MRISCFLAIWTVIPTFAQFSSMATDYAGQRLLFTTNLSQTGSGQPDYGKLFIADWRGVQPLLIYNRDVLSTTGLYPGQPGILTNNYNVDGVDVSSNGAYISVVAASACGGYTALFCGSADASTLYDARGQVALTAAGQALLSRNGKWALAVQNTLYGATSLVLYDLSTNAKFPIFSDAGQSDWNANSIADDGTAVIPYYPPKYPGLLVFRPPASVRSIAIGRGVRSAVIDAAGTVIVWEEGFGNSTLQAVYTADLGKTVDLGTSGWSDSQPRLSDDGSTILFLSTPIVTNDPQAFLMAIDGTRRRRVTAEPEGISKAVLSGNGRVVWAATRTGRLVKIDADTGARTQYTEPLAAFLELEPWNDPVDRWFSAGSNTPGGVISVAASVMPGERVEITVHDQPAPVVRVEPQRVVFQIPWAALPNPGVTSVPLGIRKPDSPSWSGDKWYVILQALSPRLLASVHQDFSALITAQQPAQAGEIIHFFGAGFGPVTPPVPDGVPAPIAPLSRTLSAVTCDILNNAGTNTGPADVLFAGLAPAMLGIYQLDVRLPDHLPEVVQTPFPVPGSLIQVACHVGDSAAVTGIPVGR